ncbi:MAG: PD-(D/E)XK nuclease family protein, partial [Pseudomonadota bacterium]
GVVRPRGGHPRVSVYGLLEARLQSADLILLAGLNEGVWPNAASTDSFLSRPMRETLGLPSPEHLIGRAAHDFAQCAAAPEVVLSWSARKGRSPSAPSRWVVRLNSFLHKADCYQKVDETARLRALARHQTQPNQIISVKPPLPKPPLEARPRRLSLSDIGVLTRDPYAIYAKHVLGLFPMDRVAAPLGPREKGTYVHSIFEQFARKFPDTLPQDILEQARQTADQVFLDERYPKEYAIFWMSDIDRVLNFLKTYEEKVRAEGRPLLLEGSGQWTFDMKGAPFTLRARVDRIDLCQDGSVSIVDFKTGDRQATMKQDKSFNPQLSLTALMVKVGAFEDLGPMTASRIAYLVVSDEDPSKGVFKANRSLEDPDLKPYLQEVEGHFLSHLAGYFDRDRGYPSQPRPFLQNEYGDYDHLARRGEWGQGGDDQGEAS